MSLNALYLKSFLRRVPETPLQIESKDALFNGEAPKEPVVSLKSGHVFDKPLIVKYIQQHHACPITAQPLAVEDLLPLQASAAVIAQVPSAASIPSMLQLFQNEWDSLMLESFTLKQKYQELRQELSHALYQHDAACRVIGRLLHERDSAREALLSLKSQLSQNANGEVVEHAEAAATHDGDVEMAVAGQIPEPIFAEIEQLAQNLSKSRKRKNKSAVPLISAGQLPELSVKSANQVHAYAEPEHLHVAFDAATEAVAVTASDKSITVLQEGSVVATLKGHTKKVSSLQFLANSLLLSGSADKSIKGHHLNDKQKWSCEFTFKGHSADVTGLAAHPLPGYFLSVDAGGLWSFNQYADSTATVLTSKQSEGESYTSCTFHPDGLIFATASAQGTIKIWDLKSETVAFDCPEAHEGGISSMSFSDNGYYFATSGIKDGLVRIWDLRKLAKIHELTVASSDITKVAFDESAAFLVVAASSLTVYQCKTWEVVTSVDLNGEAASDFYFGKKPADFVTVLGQKGTLSAIGLNE